MYTRLTDSFQHHSKHVTDKYSMIQNTSNSFDNSYIHSHKLLPTASIQASTPPKHTFPHFQIPAKPPRIHPIASHPPIEITLVQNKRHIKNPQNARNPTYLPEGKKRGKNVVRKKKKEQTWQSSDSAKDENARERGEGEEKKGTFELESNTKRNKKLARHDFGGKSGKAQKNDRPRYRIGPRGDKKRLPRKVYIRGKAKRRQEKREHCKTNQKEEVWEQNHQPS